MNRWPKDQGAGVQVSIRHLGSCRKGPNKVQCGFKRRIIQICPLEGGGHCTAVEAQGDASAPLTLEPPSIVQCATCATAHNGLGRVQESLREAHFEGNFKYEQ